MLRFPRHLATGYDSGASGLEATSPDDEAWHQDQTDVDDVAENFDQFGWALA